MAFCPKCNSRKKCGCSDKPLSTSNCNPLSECGVPNPCPECFDMHCISYSGPDIPGLGIQTGDRLDEIINILILYNTNPGCVTGASGCTSPLNLYLDNITAYTATLHWTLVNGATGYTVESKNINDVSWTVYPSVGATVSQSEILNIEPEGTYQVRVTSNCTGGSCVSIVHQFTVPAE